jgi:hypothetical protein
MLGFAIKKTEISCCIKEPELIHTFGCSFTRWHWPTWADWLARYQDKPLINHAGPGYTNELIYHQVLANLDRIQSSDSIYIMWTGSNRVSQWYDADYVERHRCAGFFPDTQGELWYGQGDWRGFYKTHPDHEPSLTHMIITTFDVILRTQMLLDRLGGEYRMMFWQNPWHDVRERRQSEYSYTWHERSEFSAQQLSTAKSIMHMHATQRILKLIDWTKFIPGDVNLQDPEGWQGLWEYNLSQRELVMLNHVQDHHPNCLAQHDWAVNKILGGNADLRAEAKEQALRWQHRPLPPHDRINEIKNFFRG